MLKIEVKGDLKPVAYRDIPVGAVFTYIHHYDEISHDGTIYFKAQEGSAVSIAGPGVGVIEYEDEFISDAVWVILNATLTIQK